MALVSVKNFMSPFKNKVHLGLIFFTVALFTVFRAAGGALTLSTKAPRAAVETGTASDKIERELQREDRSTRAMPESLDELDPGQELSKLGLDAESTQRAMPKARQDDRDADLVERMIQVEKPGPKRSAPPNQADLEEVERRLGLR